MKQEEILFFLGSACVVVFAWIAFTFLHNSLTSTISGMTLQTITPISASFDTTVIDMLEKRNVVAPLSTIPAQSQTAIVVTSAPTPIPTATQPQFLLFEQTVSTSSSQTSATQGGSLQ